MPRPVPPRSASPWPSQPTPIPRKSSAGPIFFYISRWPAENVMNEISVKMGYPFAQGAKVTATIGTAKFDLFTKDEGAFVEKPEMETKIIEAMKTGNTMKIEGKSARGTATSDVYSLERPIRCARPRRQGMQRLSSCKSCRARFLSPDTEPDYASRPPRQAPPTLEDIHEEFDCRDACRRAGLLPRSPRSPPKPSTCPS